jgi:hypothetical protein
MRLSSIRRETYQAWNHVNRQPIIRATVNESLPVNNNTLTTNQCQQINRYLIQSERNKTAGHTTLNADPSDRAI